MKTSLNISEVFFFFTSLQLPTKRKAQVFSKLKYHRNKQDINIFQLISVDDLSFCFIITITTTTISNIMKRLTYWRVRSCFSASRGLQQNVSVCVLTCSMRCLQCQTSSLTVLHYYFLYYFLIIQTFSLFTFSVKMVENKQIPVTLFLTSMNRDMLHNRFFIWRNAAWAYISAL